MFFLINYWFIFFFNRFYWFSWFFSCIDCRLCFCFGFCLHYWFHFFNDCFNYCFLDRPIINNWLCLVSGLFFVWRHLGSSETIRLLRVNHQHDHVYFLVSWSDHYWLVVCWHRFVMWGYDRIKCQTSTTTWNWNFVNDRAFASYTNRTIMSENRAVNIYKYRLCTLSESLSPRSKMIPQVFEQSSLELRTLTYTTIPYLSL